MKLPTGYGHISENNTSRFLHFLPLSGIGHCFFFLSCLLLIAGIIRQELASLLWGSGFLFLLLYFFLGSRIYGIIQHRFLAGHQRAVELYFVPDGVFPGTRERLNARIWMPAFSLPGFTTTLGLSLSYGDIEFVIKLPLIPGRNHVEGEFPAPGRGIYVAHRCSFIVRDILGFSSFIHSLSKKVSLCVYPPISITGFFPRLTSPGGEKHQGRDSRVRSEELLEVRKYYPGDDVKRLNWKVYAHAGELFLRIGEDTPPPLSRVLCVLNPGSDSALLFQDREIRRDYLDSLVSCFGDLVYSLKEHGYSVSAILPGLTEGITVSETDRTSLLTALSSIWWDDRPMSLPIERNWAVVIVSSPQSANLSRLLDECLQRHWRIHLLLKDYAFPDITTERFTLRNLVFLRPGKKNVRADKRRMVKLSMEKFSRAVSDALNKYTGKEWRGVKVAKIEG
ncbi:MAG: DUF58 domain-containing protein [Spirochaetota bacterium]